MAKKSDLLDIAAHYELTTVNKSMLKQEIKIFLVQFLVDKEILDSSALSLVLVTQTGLQMRELEIQRQIELEKLRLEQEKLKMEMEERVKEQERQMQKERMEMEEREKEKERQMQIEREKLKFDTELRMKELEMQNMTVKRQPITKTCLYEVDPLKPHFYIVKLGFTGVYIIFLISAQKHKLWVFVRTASLRRF